MRHHGFGWVVLTLALAAPVVMSGAPPRVIAFVDALKGSEDVELRWPVVAAASSAEEIAVADAFGPRLLRFRKVGVSWQLQASAAMAGTPVALVWDGARYVASHRGGAGLVAYEGDGLVQRRLPLPRGLAPGALAVHAGGDLLVYDAATRRAVRIADGVVSQTVALPGEVAALATRPSGGFLAALPARGAVLQVDASGALTATWELPPFEDRPAWPSGLALEPGGDVIVVDRHAGRLLVVDASGEVAGIGSRQGSEPGLLLFPRGIARLPDGLFVVADEGNGRAQLFRRSD